MARPSHCATLSVHGIHRIRRKSCGESVAIVESCDPTGARRDDVHLLRHFPALRVLSRHDSHVPRRFRMESYAASTWSHMPLRQGLMCRFGMMSCAASACLSAWSHAPLPHDTTSAGCRLVSRSRWHRAQTSAHSPDRCRPTWSCRRRVASRGIARWCMMRGCVRVCVRA